MKSKSLKRISPTNTCPVKGTGPVKGFTLIEIIITLAIGAIVLSIAVPSFQNYIQNNRRTTAINDLQTALALARNIAITRRVRTTVCKSANASSNAVNPSCNNAGDWSQGWVVFSDPNNPGVLDNGEPIHRVYGPLRLSAAGSFSGDAADGDPTRVSNRVSFTPQGMSAGTLGTISYTDGSHTGALVISFGGQVRYE